MGHVRYCEQYPDLFVPLSAEQGWAVEQTLANGRLEGWDPDRLEVAELIEHASGRSSLAEYVARGSERRRQLTGLVPLSEAAGGLDFLLRQVP